MFANAIFRNFGPVLGVHLGKRAHLLESEAGGEGGIRTPGRALRPYDGLANRCFRPLSHLSVSVAPEFRALAVDVPPLYSGDPSVSRGGISAWRSPVQKPVRPRDEVLPIGRVGMTAFVLSPGELAVEHRHIDGRHFRGVIVGDAEILSAQEPEHRSFSDRRHVAALMIEP